MAHPTTSLARAYGGQRQERAPVWLMRQAGRYLPEYREVRARARDFMDFVHSPALATEVTLQPLRRFDLDAAIVFSDILVVPDALGRRVWFVEGEGPRLDALNDAGQVFAPFPVEKMLAKLATIYETLERTRAALPADKALIGFAGAPWTVATYMIEGRGGPEKLISRRWAYERAGDLSVLLDTLVEATAHHLHAQEQAGADVLKVFDSWAEGLPDGVFDRVCIAPTRALVARARELGVRAPIVGFPRGAGSQVLRYAQATGVSAVALDQGQDLAWAHGALPPGMCVQGAIDPLLTLVGGQALDEAVDANLAVFAARPHVLNLGHGLTPQSRIEAVAQLVARAQRG